MVVVDLRGLDAVQHDRQARSPGGDLVGVPTDNERFKFFKPPYPTSTLIGVASLAMPEMLVEIEVEAIIETSRLRLPKGAVSR